MIAIRNLVYRNLSIPGLSVPEGTTTLIGPNGSGKTTFLKLVAGIILPKQGTIEIDGLTPRSCSTGWVNEYPDKSLLFPTVADEIASPLEFRSVSCIQTAARVRKTAAHMGISSLLPRFTKDISGGERALVSLASALIANPDLLVLDEFDSHLDLETRRRVDEVLEKSEIRYIIRCTQNMDVAVNSTHLLFFTGGQIVYSGSPCNVIRQLQGTAFYPIDWEDLQRNEPCF